MPRPPRNPASWLVLACALVLAPAGAPAASAEDADARATLERSVRFLQDAQNRDGGFGGEVGQPSDPGFTAWAAYALAAAGINPQDQAKPDGTDVHSYLIAAAGVLSQTTDFDRAALVALASGTSPSDFGGVDAIGTVLSRQLPDGSFPQLAGGQAGWVNATIWSIFPLSAVDRPGADTAVQRAAQWLLGRQLPGGGWPATVPASPPDVDMTGAAVQALRAAGHGGGEAEQRAFEFLRGAQEVDGGFEAVEGGRSNAATTAWVVQGMWAAGLDPRSWRTPSGRDPLAYLTSLQRPDGSIGYTATSSTNSLWITAQVGPALAGRAYPLGAVPREARALGEAVPERSPAAGPPPTTGQVPRSSRRGHGGFRRGRGGGVIAGGGGRGAPLFSAPQPQSGGTTPRGSRQVEANASPEPPPPGSLPAPGTNSSAGDGAAAGARGEGRGGAGGGGTVEGLLVSGSGSRDPAAPGLFAASSGGDPDPRVLAGLLAALLAAVAIGSRRERAGAVTS
ncbi:MAG TPA: prenyltransferase/squalene oxidase repeat-containing protein [Solirubrobacterales bacterium]|nr:prenyltransferase/squalene oxidase repeat-containing protein [Solirubrobacterales bacterium]